MDKKVAEALFENNPINEFGLIGQDLPLAISTLAFVDSKGVITVRAQTHTDGREAPINFALSPYAAARLMTALADLVHRSGEFSIDMTVREPGKGVMFRLPR